jgi:lipopolysaccharide export system protein LptA
MNSSKLITCIFLALVYIFLPLFAQVRPPLLISPLSITPKKSSVSTTIQTDKETKEKAEETSTLWGGENLTQEVKEIEGIPVKVFSLTGNSWIMHKKVRLTSSKIEVIGEDALKASLVGGVKVDDPENKISFYSSGAEYDKLSETIEFKTRSKLFFTDTNNKKTKIAAGKIKRLIAEYRTELNESVVIENDEYIILSDSAIFQEKEKVLVMEGYPYIFGKQSFLTGSKIKYDSQKNTTSLEENTQLFSFSIENPKKKTDEDIIEESTPSSDSNTDENTSNEVIKERVITSFSGDTLVSGNSKGSSFVSMDGNAKVIRPDTEFSADNIKAFGEGNRDINALGNVIFFDKENRFKIYGSKLEHFDKESYSHVTEDARMEFLSKDLEAVSATITAIEIERFGDKKELVARGNVKIVSENLTALGEYATYFEEQKKLELTGNTRVVRDGNTIQCGKVLVFPEENRVVITDGIKLKEPKPKK